MIDKVTLLNYPGQLKTMKKKFGRDFDQLKFVPDIELFDHRFESDFHPGT